MFLKWWVLPLPVLVLHSPLPQQCVAAGEQEACIPPFRSLLLAVEPLHFIPHCTPHLALILLCLLLTCVPNHGGASLAVCCLPFPLPCQLLAFTSSLLGACGSLLFTLSALHLLFPFPGLCSQVLPKFSLPDMTLTPLPCLQDKAHAQSITQEVLYSLTPLVLLASYFSLP